jgi:hypothetical protein
MTLIVDPVHSEGSRYVPRRGPKAFADAGYCGRSFNQGLLRFHDAATAQNYRQLCFEAFPQLRRMDARADVLAFDWNGKQYLTATLSNEPGVAVLVADLATATVERLATVEEFAAVLKLDTMADFFDGGLYDEWRTAVGRPGEGLAFNDCVEYTIPLWAGGVDEIANLQLIDLDVSWTIGAQLLINARTAGEK